MCLKNQKGKIPCKLKQNTDKDAIPGAKDCNQNAEDSKKMLCISQCCQEADVKRNFLSQLLKISGYLHVLLKKMKVVFTYKLQYNAFITISSNILSSTIIC